MRTGPFAGQRANGHRRISGFKAQTLSPVPEKTGWHSPLRCVIINAVTTLGCMRITTVHFVRMPSPFILRTSRTGIVPLNLEDLRERVLALNCLRLVSLMPWIFEARFEERDLIRHEELGRAKAEFKPEKQPGPALPWSLLT